MECQQGFFHKNPAVAVSTSKNPHGKMKRGSFPIFISRGGWLLFYMLIFPRWWSFKHFLMFTPKIAGMIQFDEHILQMGGSTTNQFSSHPSDLLLGL